jgi:hypothetical protein
LPEALPTPHPPSSQPPAIMPKWMEYIVKTIQRLEEGQKEEQTKQRKMEGRLEVVYANIGSVAERLTVLEKPADPRPRPIAKPTPATAAPVTMPTPKATVPKGKATQPPVPTAALPRVLVPATPSLPPPETSRRTVPHQRVDDDNASFPALGGKIVAGRRLAPVVDNPWVDVTKKKPSYNVVLMSVVVK